MIPANCLVTLVMSVVPTSRLYLDPQSTDILEMRPKICSAMHPPLDFLAMTYKPRNAIYLPSSLPFDCKLLQENEIPRHGFDFYNLECALVLRHLARPRWDELRMRQEEEV